MNPPTHHEPDMTTPGTTNPLIIGLTGPAGSGKDTVAGILQTHCNAAVLAFADALRNEIVDAYCIEHTVLTRRETKELAHPALALSRCTDGAFVDRMVVHHMAGMPDGGMAGERIDLAAHRSPRQIMQWWGTEYRRRQDPNYWVAKARQTVHWTLKTLRASAIVLTDVRFDNEAELVRSLGGEIWQVKRPGCDVASGAHTSEVTGATFAPSVVINNCFDVRHLQGVVLSAWAERAWGLPGVQVEVQPTTTTPA